MNVPNDEDTTIEFSRTVDIDGIEAVYQKWRWDGILAESLIFSTDKFSKINRDDILQLAFKSGLIDDIKKITYEDKNNGFIFVNFNFIY